MGLVTMLYPGHSAEDDLRRWAGRAGVPIDIRHTWTGPTTHEVSALRDLGADDQLHPAATEAVRTGATAVVWACTSGSFIDGLSMARMQAERLGTAAGVPATSTTLAFVDALDHLESRRVALAASYPPAVSARLVALLEESGRRVVAVSSGSIASGEDAGQLTGSEVRALVDRVDPTESDVLLVPDTALHTVDLIVELEDRFAQPVLTANQVTVWAAARLLGCAVDATELGSLFSR